MNTRRRTSNKTILSLESLDARVVPSAVGLSASAHAGHSAHVAFRAHSHHATHSVAKPAHHASSQGHSAGLAVFGGGFAFPAPVAPATGASAGFMMPITMAPAATSTISAPSSAGPSVSPIPAPAPAVAGTAATPATSPTAATASTDPGTSGNATATAPAATTTTTTSATTPSFVPENSGPLAKATNDLASLYKDFTTSKTTTPYSSYMTISGTNVKVDIQGSGDFAAFQAALTGLGFQVNNADPQREIVEGMLPINQILAAAQLSQTVGIHPVYNPGFA